MNRRTFISITGALMGAMCFSPLFSTAEAAPLGKRILVAYFSHTGENYGVGVISKGNTCIMAEMIAEELGADIFEIIPEEVYPEGYDECTKVASREKAMKVRPTLKGTLPDLSQYDAVFIGYPIWWGDMPMPVYTFLENYDWKGKVLIPFSTHEGSGLSSTPQQLALTCAGAIQKQGLAITGRTVQNQPKEARARVKKWLQGLSL